MKDRHNPVMRKSTVALMLIAPSVAACGPRSSGAEVDTTIVPESAPTVSSVSAPDVAPEPTPEGSARPTTTTAAVTDTTSPDSGSIPESPEDGVQAVPPEVEIRDVDEIDQVLAEIDGALAGIDLDADEGELP